jgi:hypothetical protein
MVVLVGLLGELGQHLVGEQLQRLADVLVAGAARLAHEHQLVAAESPVPGDGRASDVHDPGDKRVSDCRMSERCSSWVRLVTLSGSEALQTTRC